MNTEATRRRVAEGQRTFYRTHVVALIEELDRALADNAKLREELEGRAQTLDARVRRYLADKLPPVQPMPLTQTENGDPLPVEPQAGAS